MSSDLDFRKKYQEYAELVNDALPGFIPAVDSRSDLLREAMEYSLEAGGKRLRPVLLLACCEICGGAVEQAMPYAAALEFIHTYSLIHDDHPSVDDDDLRRGKPTNHKVFGDGAAILAGDGLLNSAFEIMLADIGSRALSGDAERLMSGIRAAREITAAAGVQGMIAGQITDLMKTAGREQVSVNSEKAGACLAKAGSSDEDILLYIHANKTGAMIRAAVRAGALLGGCSGGRLDDFSEFGEKIGVVFQIVDDILDVTGDEAVLGKKTGMDEAMGKLSYPSTYGLKKSYEIAHRITTEAVGAGVRAARGHEEGETFLTRMALDLASRLS